MFEDALVAIQSQPSIHASILQSMDGLCLLKSNLLCGCALCLVKF